MDESPSRGYSDEKAARALRRVNLRPTRQRLALCRLLYGRGNRHVTAEVLHGEARDLNLSVSLATIYNTLHQLTAAGLLRQVIVDGAKIYFDTNTSDHPHYFLQEDGALSDVPGGGVRIDGLPEPPPGTEIERVDVVVRLRHKRSS
ncbi:MAG: iron response transcriptional regulator IrrA [Alphaproteobacteria bacterium]